MSIPMAAIDTPLPVRIVSAGLGSLLTALALTPLDVAKTRQQVAAAANLSDVSVVAQIRPLSHRLPPTSGTLATILSVARAEGVLALWSGFSASMVIALPSAVLYYAAYDGMRDSLRAEAPPGSVVHALAPMLAGMGGRTVTAAVVSPLELLRTRAMALQPSGGDSALAVLRREVAQAGPRVLWRGLTPTLLRDVPFSGMYWLAYERFKAGLTALVQERRAAGVLHASALSRAGGASGSGTASAAPPLSFWEAYAITFAAGSAAGGLAATVTTPFDVVKTLVQTQAATVAEPSVSAACGCSQGVHFGRRLAEAPCGAAVAMGCPPGLAAAAAAERGPRTSVAPRSTLALLAEIRRVQGLRGLFAGLPARVAKVAPACAIMISSYEAGKRAFAAHVQQSQQQHRHE